MELNEILALVNAGYTKADIEAMGGSQAQQAAQPAQPAASAQTEPPAQTQPEQTLPAQTQPAKEQPAQTQPAQTQQPESDRYEKLEALLTQLIGTQQAANINASGPAAVPPVRTSTDILGSVIAPPRKDTKK